jgi:hypothetical protein
MKVEITLKNFTQTFEVTDQGILYDVVENGLVYFIKEYPDPRGGGKIKIKLFVCPLTELQYFQYKP